MKKLVYLASALMIFGLTSCNNEVGPEYTTPPVVGNLSMTPHIVKLSDTDTAPIENVYEDQEVTLTGTLSNTYGWIMLNTGNKSEASMGYSTLYGDTAGSFAPIGGLYKTDVYAVARWRNEQAEREGAVPPIPEHVFTKPPSAELAPGQMDEENLGIDYATLDRILKLYGEKHLDAQQIADEGFDPDEVERIIRRTDGYAYKRALEPPYPDVDFYA